MVFMIIPIRIYKEFAILQTEIQTKRYKILSQKTEFRPPFFRPFSVFADRPKIKEIPVFYLERI